MKRQKLIILAIAMAVVVFGAAIAFAAYVPTLGNMGRAVYGQVTIPAGQTTPTITIAGLRSTDSIIGTLNTNPSSSAQLLSITPGNGSADVRFSTAITTTCTLSFIIPRAR